MSERPLCFVLMPFGQKKDPKGGPEIDFNRVYQEGIRPAIEDAGMEPVRADQEETGGIIHKPMFERLLLCDFAVADLTTANANVFYELGVRHAARPFTTLAIFAQGHEPPFDVNYLRAVPYHLGKGNRFSAGEAEALRKPLADRLKQLRTLSREQAATDSPIFQLLPDYGEPDISRLKTDTFRDRMRYSQERKRQLAQARSQGDPAAVHAVEAELGELDAAEVGVLVDLFLSYRALKDWQGMIDLYERLPATVRRSEMMREQLAFAHNRKGERERAKEILEELIAERGPTSENCGLLGRVYKDLWLQAKEADRGFKARGFLDKAIDTYRRGFEADWRDAYPGINVVTLLDVRGGDESLAEKGQILPVVRYSVGRRLASTDPDYWDYATLLELTVLADEESEATGWLGKALAAVRETWEPASTANNLKLIREARRERGVEQPWLDEVIGELEEAAA